RCEEPRSAVGRAVRDEETWRIVGGRPLRGRVRVGGAKNAALPMLAATLLLDGSTELRRVPDLTDTRLMVSLLRGIGANVTQTPGSVTVDPQTSPRGTVVEPAPDLVGGMRGAVSLLGPLVGRASLRGGGIIRLGPVGGCDLGPRPIDRHLAGLEVLGATIARTAAGVELRVERLRGATIDLAAPPAPGLPSVPTVTGTMNLLCAAAAADGTSRLRGAAREPEVVALGRLLVAAGARIDGLGSDEISVTGVRSLSGVSGAHPAAAVPGDRIEAATWLIAAAATGGRIVVDGAVPEELHAVTELLKRTGAIVSTCGRGVHRAIRLIGPTQAAAFRAVSGPFPGLPTDVMPQLAALASVADGESRLTDRVFPNRTAHFFPFTRLAAVVERGCETTRIAGGALSPADVTAPDLRAAAGLLIAALTVSGPSDWHGSELLRRGYERPLRKLRGLGANVERVDQMGNRPGPSSERGGWRLDESRRILRGSRSNPSEIPACPAVA
ncbi:MAG: UDP-N-acetylglucosamine 1-carboxyvinyltransferase, partial [Planctomycetota bacterium]